MGVAILEGDRTCPRARVLNVITPTHLDSLFSPRYLDTIGIGASLFIHISQLSYTMTTNSISSRLAKAKHEKIQKLDIIPNVINGYLSYQKQIATDGLSLTMQPEQLLLFLSHESVNSRLTNVPGIQEQALPLKLLGILS